jgi:hypothetical protein
VQGTRLSGYPFFVLTIWLASVSACSSVSFRTTSQKLERLSVQGLSLFSSIRRIEYLPAQGPRLRMLKRTTMRSDRPY